MNEKKRAPAREWNENSVNTCAHTCNPDVIPDLLEALENIKALATPGATDTDYTPDELMVEFAAIARDALAKARGQA